MKKVMSLMLVFSVVFMGFASTLAQSPNLEAQTFASTIRVDESTFAFEAELGDAELSEVDGEGPLGAVALGAVGAVAGAVVGAVGVGVIAATGGSSEKQRDFFANATGAGLATGIGAGIAAGPL